MDTDEELLEGEVELGDGVTALWVHDSEGNPVGIVERHMHAPAALADGTEWGEPHRIGGSVPIDPSFRPGSDHWRIVAGTAGSFEGLTLEPSIACHTCPNHGWIREGKWVPA